MGEKDVTGTLVAIPANCQNRDIEISSALIDYSEKNKGGNSPVVRLVSLMGKAHDHLGTQKTSWCEVLNSVATMTGVLWSIWP